MKVVAAVVIIVVGVLVEACASSQPPRTPGADPSSGAPSVAARATASVVPASSPSAGAGSPGFSLPPYQVTIDPARFVAGITNPYFPLKSGMIYVYDSTKDGTPRRAEMTITSETKTIMGVPCIVVRDVLTSNAEIVEKTVDWYAQDVDGNVWYFGEDTAEYESGKVISTHGTWLAGVDAALPGIVMKAAPAVGDGYRQEYRPGEAEDYAKVVDLNATSTEPAGTYAKVVVTEDTDLLDTTKFEHKSYAPGVGFIASVGTVNGHHEETHLAQILTGG